MMNTKTENTKKKLIELGCVQCGASKVISVNEANYYEWLNRKLLIQHAFPEVDSADREMMISGTCGNCFDVMFGEN